MTSQPFDPLLEKSVSAAPTEDLLIILEEERSKFCDHHTTMQVIVDELVGRGVYLTTPNMQKQGITALRMVESYGAKWHVYTGKLTCPHCGADLRNLESGPPFKREIGQYDLGQDRTTHFICPDCKKVL